MTILSPIRVIAACTILASAVVFDCDGIVFPEKPPSTRPPGGERAAAKSVDDADGGLARVFNFPSPLDVYPHTEISQQTEQVDQSVVEIPALLREIRRGKFSAAARYLQITVDCRKPLAASPDSNSASQICSAGSLATSDAEVEFLLKMGVNQQDSDAEIQLMSLWFDRTLRAFEKHQSLKAPDSGASLNQPNQAMPLRESFASDMAAIQSLLSASKDRNVRAAEMLEVFSKSGMFTLLTSEAVRPVGAH